MSGSGDMLARASQTDRHHKRTDHNIPLHHGRRSNNLAVDSLRRLYTIGLYSLLYVFATWRCNARSYMQSSWLIGHVVVRLIPVCQTIAAARSVYDGLGWFDLWRLRVSINAEVDASRTGNDHCRRCRRPIILQETGQRPDDAESTVVTRLGDTCVEQQVKACSQHVNWTELNSHSRTPSVNIVSLEYTCSMSSTRWAPTPSFGDERDH